MFFFLFFLFFLQFTNIIFIFHVCPPENGKSFCVVKEEEEKRVKNCDVEKKDFFFVFDNPIDDLARGNVEEKP